MLNQNLKKTNNEKSNKLTDSEMYLYIYETESLNGI